MARLIAGLSLLLMSLTPLWAQGGSLERRFRLQGISFRYELRHDRLRFNFHNPSSFNTPTLVPHEFVQTYTADNQWGMLELRYSFLGICWESELGMTPQRTTYGDDYDTFYQPDENVIVSGTTGNVSMRSYAFAQHAWVWQRSGWSLGTGYRYQRYRSNFQFGNSFETQTKPPSAIFEKLPIAETTKARLHEFDALLERRWTVSPRLSIIQDVRVAPSTAALLSTILPLKYPGEEIVFLAKSFGLSTRLGLRMGAAGSPVEVYAEYQYFRSYKSDEFRRQAFLIGIGFGWSGAGLR